MMSDYRELMDALAVRIGIVGGRLKPDADGVCRIGTRDIRVAFMDLPERQALLIHCAVCELPVEGADAFKSALLRENFMGRGAPGGAFSLSGDDVVYLHRYMPYATTDAAAFVRAVEEFMRIVMNWRRLAEAYGPVAEQRAQKREEERYLSLSGFMQV